MTIICPDCKKEITPEATPVVGDVLECENCGTEVEVVKADPVEVRIIEEEK